MHTGLFNWYPTNWTRCPIELNVPVISNTLSYSCVVKQQMGGNRCVLFYSYTKEFVLSASTRIIGISRGKIPLILPYLVTVFFNTYISRACVKFLGPPHRLLDAEQALVTLGVGHSHLPLQGLRHAFQFVYCVRSVPHNQFALWPQYTINLRKNCRQFASVNRQHRFSI